MIPFIYVLTTAHGDVLDAAEVSNVSEADADAIEDLVREKYSQSLTHFTLKKFTSKEELEKWIKDANGGGEEGLDQHMDKS